MVPVNTPLLNGNEKKYLNECIDTGWISSEGPFIKRFEDDMSSYVGRKYATACTSGTAALDIAVGALELKSHDEVIMPSFTIISCAQSLVTHGVTPVLIDSDYQTFNMKVEDIEAKITSKTKAIMIAHTLGIPFDLDTILEIAEKHNLWVIEDNCDALGATYSLKREYSLINNKKVFGNAKTGTIGHIGTSSFYPAHQITMGEGGAVYTDSLEIYKIALSFRDWGRDCWCSPGKDNTCKSRFKWQLGLLPQGYDHKYTYSHIGYNLKITDMQAAIGVAQMDRVQGFAEKRYDN